MKPVFSLLLIGSLFVMNGCKKEEPAPEPAPAESTYIKLSFSNVVGISPLTLSSAYQYVNANNDSFGVTLYKYYISNVKFTDNNGNTWAEPESYHLIDQSNPSSLNVTIGGIPAATYTSMQFMIGVDSARNVSGSQTGALDPANDMFWTWNTGYIMAKFEGKSPVSTASAHNLTFHIGGYSGTNAAQRNVAPSFGAFSANVSASVTPVIHINSDVLEWFANPTTIDFSTMNSVTMSGTSARMIADNYANMFTVTGIDN